MTQRNQAPHRASRQSLSQSLSILGDAIGISRRLRTTSRIGLAAVLTAGLVAAIQGPATAETKTAPAPAAVAAAQTTRVPSAVLTAMTLMANDSSVTAPATAVVSFESGGFRAVPLPPPPKPRPEAVVSSATRERHVRAARVAVTPRTTTKRVVARRVVAKSKPPVRKAPARKVVTRKAAVGNSSIIAIARRYVGTYYRYGGTTPSGFDCSGFTGYVYRQAGIKLPRMARDQYRAVRHVSSPRPGDLIFFVNGGHATHVGIYAGGGQMYDSPRTGKAIGLRSYKYYNGTVVFGRP